MEQLLEYEACGARPRRHIRPPARYADYDLGYIGQRYREDIETLHQEGKAGMTPLAAAYDSSPLSRQQRRDASLHEMECYGAEGQQHTQETQLAPLLSLESDRGEWFYERFTPLHPTLHTRHPQEDLKTELEDIRHERHLLQRTQHRMSSDLVELRALRADMRRLVDAVQNLQSPSSPRTNQPESMQPLPTAAPAEEDDWPAPPPWPDPAMTGLLPADLLPLPPPHNSVQATVELPYVKEEAISPPITKPAKSLLQVQQSEYGFVPATRPLENPASYQRPWVQPVQPPLQSFSLPPPEPKYPAACGGLKREPGCNPQQLLHGSWMQPQP